MVARGRRRRASESDRNDKLLGGLGLAALWLFFQFGFWKLLLYGLLAALAVGVLLIVVGIPLLYLYEGLKANPGRAKPEEPAFGSVAYYHQLLSAAQGRLERDLRNGTRQRTIDACGPATRPGRFRAARSG